MTAVMTGTGIALSFQGRFKFGIDQWAYVPFQVPVGVQRIEVSTSHDQFSLLGIGRNVLDLGIFGPAGYELGNAAGFRGWSGGARAGFTLSAINATPGYLAGPIDPGQWTLALGPVVLNPLGMDWQAQIVLTRGVQPSLRDVPAARPAVVVKRAGTGVTYTRTQCIPTVGAGSRRWPRPRRRQTWISSSPPTTTPAPPIGHGRQAPAVNWRSSQGKR